MRKRLLLASCLDQSIGKVKALLGADLAALKVVCIPTAGNVYPPEKRGWQQEEMQAFKSLGVGWNEYDMLDKSQADLTAALAGADIVYVAGGNSYYLMEQMQRCNFGLVLANFLARGGLYIGCSAGAVVACKRVDFIASMDDPSKASLSDYRGLGLVDFLCVPHTDNSHYGPIARKLMENLHEPVIGLRDDQALYYDNGKIEIF